MTIVERVGPPSAASVPSPPSATGASSHSPPSAATPRATAAATSAADAVPRNLSVAATTRTAGDYGSPSLYDAGAAAGAARLDRGGTRCPSTT